MFYRFFKIMYISLFLVYYSMNVIKTRCLVCSSGLPEPCCSSVHLFHQESHEKHNEKEKLVLFQSLPFYREKHQLDGNSSTDTSVAGWCDMATLVER